MTTEPIECLDPSEWKILKQIIIISDRNNNENELGRIYYTRPLTEGYNFVKQKMQDENSPNGVSSMRFFREYPEQKNYPEDDLDLAILSAVRKVYFKSVVLNDSILFNVELDKISVLKNRKKIPSSIRFHPDVTNETDIYQYVGKRFQAPLIPINIYGFFTPKPFETFDFTVYYDVSNDIMLQKLSSVNFE